MAETKENKETSQEYANFVSHYQEFLINSYHCFNIITFIDAFWTQEYIDVPRLLEEALEAQISAINAYQKAIEVYEKLRLNVVTELMKTDLVH